jgi:hypothetical protein
MEFFFSNMVEIDYSLPGLFQTLSIIQLKLERVKKKGKAAVA